MCVYVIFAAWTCSVGESFTTFQLRQRRASSRAAYRTNKLLSERTKLGRGKTAQTRNDPSFSVVSAPGMLAARLGGSLADLCRSLLVLVLCSSLKRRLQHPFATERTRCISNLVQQLDTVYCVTDTHSRVPVFWRHKAQVTRPSTGDVSSEYCEPNSPILLGFFMM